MDDSSPILLSDHVQFREKFQQYWDTVRTENLDYLSVFYTLIGYFSTMKTTNVYDQVSSGRMDILKVLMAGHPDRFFLLYIARHSRTKNMFGRLLYFHMNEQAEFLGSSFLNLDDLQFIRDSLHYYDPSLNAWKQGLWMQKLRENCLYVGVKTVQPTDEILTIKFQVETEFVRIEQLFQPWRTGETKFRELFASNHDLSQMTHGSLYSIFKFLLETFDKNSAGGNRLTLFFNRQNFLSFIRGALFFNSKNLETIPMYAGESLEKLAVLIRDKNRWITDQEPIFVEVYRSLDERFESEFDTEIANLPIGFGTTAKTASIVSITASQDKGIDIDIIKIAIAHGIGLLDFLEKLTKLEPDHFIANQDHIRKELLLHLDRIDTYLGHQHKVKILRHYILGLIMTMDKRFTAYKLRGTFDPANPADIFLVRSHNNGFVISMSLDIMSLESSDEIANRLLGTGLKKLVILNLNDRPYSAKSIDGEDQYPLLGIVSVDSPSNKQKIIFDPAHWSRIKTKIGRVYLSRLLLSENLAGGRPVRWRKDWEEHSMVPENRAEFVAHIKALIPEKETFVPYGTDFVGYSVKKYGRQTHTLKIQSFVGDPEQPLHVILDMSEDSQSDPLHRIKQFYKKELSSSIEKLNTCLAKVVLDNKNKVKLKLSYSTSFPNGQDKGEYESCYPKRKKRNDKSCLLDVEKNDEPRFHTIHRIVNTAMYLQMIKGMIGSVIDEDFSKLAREAGILTGMISLNFLGDKSIHWGQNLMKRGNMLKGGALYLGGKALSKAYLGFVIFDLVTRIKAFEQDKSQIVGIVGDSAIVAINTVSTAVEIFSTFASVEEASLELGPEVMIGEALIFAIMDGFYAAKSVQKIEQEISLTWGEEFVQWWRSFFGARRSEYLDQLIGEKMLLRKKVDDMIKKLLSLNETFQYYASPTFYIDKERHVQQTRDNLIIMDETVTVKSRVWPESKDNFRVQCASSIYERKTMSVSRSRSNRLGITTDGTTYKSTVCRKMVSIRANNNANTALIELGSGRDVAIGFSGKKNYFIIAGGKKYITGGDLADTFILVDNVTKILGTIDGMKGADILDLSQYLPSQSLVIDMMQNKLIYIDESNLIVRGIEHIIGRNGSTDRIIPNCRTKFLDSKGGKSMQFPDVIAIPYLECNQNLTVRLSGHIHVNNLENNVSVLYLVENGTNSKVRTIASGIFLLSTSLVKVDVLRYESFTLTIKSGLHDTKLLVNDVTHESKFIFSDRFQVSFMDGNLHAHLQVTNSTFDDTDMINDLLSLSRKLSLIITLKSDQKITQINNLNSSFHSPVVHFKNDPSRVTRIITVDHGKIFFEVNASCEFHNIEFHMKNMFIHVLDSWNSPQLIIDLSSIYWLFKKNDQLLTLNMKNTTNHLWMDLKIKNRAFSVIEIKYENSMLIDNLCSKVSVNIKVLMQLCYKQDEDKFILRPMPLIVSANNSIVVLSEDDIAENMEIMFEKGITAFKCRSFKNSLILANELGNHASTLIFTDYYQPSNVTVNESSRTLYDSLVFRFASSGHRLSIPEIIESCHSMIERMDS